MSHYFLLITLIGLIALSMAWIPAFSKKIGISYALIYLLLGVILYLIFPGILPLPDPQANETFTIHATEVLVIISLMGTGIKIDRPFTFKNWKAPLRLVFIAMIVCMGVTVLYGNSILGFDLASAVLLAAVLAPTDPVLASDVQVGPPNDKEVSETKFALTAEAGINDGMAFPFTFLAITLAMMAQNMNGSISNWFGIDVVYRILVGFAIGFLSGKLIGFLLFDLTKKFEFFKTREGFLAISLTLAVYGATELAVGYGFIAVFVCAITLRAAERKHDYHRNLHSFTEQIEKLLVAVMLVFFGGSLVTGILDALTWQMAIFSILFLLIIRPVSAYLSLFNIKLKKYERFAISFYGIRGMGSVFYLAYAMHTIKFDYENELWAIVAFTILLSLILHGFTATKIFGKLDKSNKALTEN
ncbi:cation:proton antiporter [Pedobacter alpinus]|uniref:Cation:proton antiporter n=1 Tax=Pedobacter alpinus TaxID=1590643 RepID=A0ABW5TWM1_9SPHI